MKDKLLEVRGPNGSKYWLEIQKKEVPLSHENAEVYSFRDFTGIVNANAALHDKELTIATSSHELKTPLQGILGMLDLLRTKY